MFVNRILSAQTINFTAQLIVADRRCLARQKV